MDICRGNIINILDRSLYDFTKFKNDHYVYQLNILSSQNRDIFQESSFIMFSRKHLFHLSRYNSFFFSLINSYFSLQTAHWS